MSSLEGLRAELLDELASRCAVTGLYTSAGRDTSAACTLLLRTLAYIDDRQEEFGRQSVELREADFGNGDASVMERWFTDGEINTLNGRPEVMAWYAELAARFDWLDVPRLTSTDWGHLIAASGISPLRVPWSRHRVLDELPVPSLVVDRSVYCYAAPDPAARWAFVDVVHPGGSPDRSPDAPVRSVRFPGHGPMVDRIVVAPAAQGTFIGR